MKYLVTRTLTSLALAVVGLAVAAPAQQIQTTIPFEFNFAGQKFPAGTYSIVQPVQNLLVLRDSQQRMIARQFASAVESRDAVNGTKLKFTSRDGQLYLSEVWKRGETSGLQLPQHEERDLVAKNRSTEGRQAADRIQP